MCVWGWMCVCFCISVWVCVHICGRVPVPPGLPLMESREEVVSEGNETELTCTAMDGKPAPTIRWMKGEQDLTGQWNNNLDLLPHTPPPPDRLSPLPVKPVAVSPTRSTSTLRSSVEDFTSLGCETSGHARIQQRHPPTWL